MSSGTRKRVSKPSLNDSTLVDKRSAVEVLGTGCSHGAWILGLIALYFVPPLGDGGWLGRLAHTESGPDVEASADLDDVIREPAGGESDADLESLADLEKVIESEDAKESPNVPPRREVTELAPEDLDAPPKRTAGGNRSREDALPPVREESADVQISPDELPLPESRPNRSSASSAVRNTISNLEFRMEGEVSRLALSSPRPLAFREVMNPGMRQVIYYFDNTETPERLQRAYDTTEFRSPVALFTLLQVPSKGKPSSKLIVQLREEKAPRVQVSERGLFIDFPAPDFKGEPQALAFGTTGIDRGLSGTAVLDGNIYLDNPNYTGKVIKRLEIKNSDVQDVLRLIAKTSGYNIVVGDDVSGKVGTLSLENVPWDQAFALVLQSKKLGYVRQGNVLRVATLGNLKSEKDEALQSEQSKIKIEALKTLLIPVSYAKASELAPQAKNFLTDRGSVDTDARTNTVIVKDIEKVVSRVQKLFAALDTPPARVAISAKIVEMKKDFARGIGVQGTFSGNTSGVNFDQQLGFGNGGSAVTTIRAPQFGSLNAAIDLAERELKVKTLANPSVTVVANRQATVTQSLSFFVPANEVAGGQLVASSRQVTTNLTLDVTPIVAGDGSIFMTVNIKNEIPTPNGKDTTIDARSINTQVLVENGDTAVVGGVFQNTVTDEREGIPLLMRIPVLGALFSRNRVIDNRNEIFIFLTAKITNAEESFKRAF